MPTPKKWHTTRTLEITYMDNDIMVARTSGGEPHLLLRNSPMCYSSENLMEQEDQQTQEDASIVAIDNDDGDEEDDVCDVTENHKWTEFFSEAIEMYGERITRCLVDREFGKNQRQHQEHHQKNSILETFGEARANHQWDFLSDLGRNLK